MRNIFIKTGVVMVLASVLAGCTGNYLAINTNPYEEKAFEKIRIYLA